MFDDTAIQAARDRIAEVRKDYPSPRELDICNGWSDALDALVELRAWGRDRPDWPWRPPVPPMPDPNAGPHDDPFHIEPPHVEPLHPDPHVEPGPHIDPHPGPHGRP